jgi:CDP-2,3-bis-(O-geranylgeranyl)-sn-glycerol synthase
MKDILFAIWFFLPAGLANVSPLYADKIPLLRNLSYPLDFNKTISGKVVFGKNKTWRGAILAVVVGIVITSLQHFLFPHSSWIRSISGPIDYQTINYILLGALLGGGAILGDAVESFAKRRLVIRPGSTWFPYDQIDYIVGGMVLSLFAVKLNFFRYVLVLIVWFFIHILASYLSLLTGIKKRST